MASPSLLMKQAAVRLLMRTIGLNKTQRLSILKNRMFRRVRSSQEGFKLPNARQDVKDDFLKAMLEVRHLGRLGESELEQIYKEGCAAPAIFCIASGRELDQIVRVLKAARTPRVESCHPFSKPVLSIPDDVSSIILVSDSVHNDASDNLQRSLRPDQRLLTLVPKPRPSLGVKLVDHLPLRVVLLNDVGFQGGAGIGQKRQAQSFLRLGWEVSMVCWSAGDETASPEDGRWYGVVSLTDVHSGMGCNDATIIEKVSAAVMEFDPDLVVVGNLHGAGWPLAILPRLQRLGVTVVAYLHDLHWVTGRCAYPGPCLQYLVGCDERCPTAAEYPALAPDKINAHWREGARVFTGHAAIPLVCNSSWTMEVARSRFGAHAQIQMVHLALDETLFAPMDKRVVRRLLGLPEDEFLVLLGAQYVHEPRKGGPVFRELHEKLVRRNDLGVLLFGYMSDKLSSLKSFGLVRDERLMPLLFNAADVFVGTAVEEAFGLTLMEAAACGVPVVAIQTGGVADIVQRDRTGILVEEASSDALMDAIDKLRLDQQLRWRLSQAARARVERRFTLDVQGQTWRSFLQQLAAERDEGAHDR
jgi:glycosyltransferase involved in cell wall biosynthesis